MAPRLLFNFMCRCTPRHARLPSRTARHLASRGQLRATKPSTANTITRRDVTYRAIRRRLTCRVPWHVPLPPTVAAHTPPPSESSQTTRFLVGTAYCAMYYHYHYCSPTRTLLNASTARRHVPPSRVVTSLLRAALATHSAPLSRLSLRCQLQSIRPASNETARAKPDNVQSFCCDAYSLPAAHTNN